MTLRYLAGVAIIAIFSMNVFAEQNPTAAELGGSSQSLKPPKAQSSVVDDILHGVKVSDPYRRLEDGTAAETQRFVSDEMAYTRSMLDRLPGRDRIHERLSQLLAIGTVTAPEIGGDYYFYTRREGTQNQPVLYVREGVNGTDRVLIDPNKLSADGTVALDWWTQSHDGKYMAYGTSQSGSEMSTLHIIETATGKTLPDQIERTRAASIAWMPDDSGFFYTRYPKKGEVPEGQEVYNRHVFYHKLGADPTKDELIFGQGRDPQDWPNLNISEDGRWLAITVEQGWAKTELFLKDVKSNTAPVPVVTGKDFVYRAIPFRDKLYILTNEGAPRFRVFTVPATDPKRENWKEIIPQTDVVIDDVRVIGGRLVLQCEKNASSLLKVAGLDGRQTVDVTMPALGTVFGLGGEWDSRELFFAFQSFTFPPQIMRVELNSVKGKQVAGSLWTKVDAPTVSPDQYEVKQVWYSSKDGTKVPMFVVSKKGLVLNGANGTLLTGYGGFNVSMSPSFNRGAYLWLEHGGIYALANLRGGSEFGEEWHQAGMLDKKQNVFDDFIAAAEYLIAQRYTNKDKLAIQGGSNGGLLVGAALTQRPDLFRAVVCQVPLLDMLRYQNFQIAKLWIPEYGSADDPEQFKWLYAYSPYHHVKDATLYPSVLFMTADTDTRVDPMHAKKMAALMQAKAANGPDRPILLRIETKAGHGAGKPVAKLIEEGTDSWSYLFWQLGVKP